MTAPAHPAPASGPVFLIGFMGVGKTTVGRLLAARMGRPFIDLDEVVERRAGCSIPEIFEEQGEASFRLLEAQALAEAARSEAVVAAGGGAPSAGNNLATMRRHGVVVLLAADTETLLQRLSAPDGQRSRPLLASASCGTRLAEVVATLCARRASAYAQADVIVETSGLSPEQVVDQVLAAIGQAAPVASRVL